MKPQKLGQQFIAPRGAAAAILLTTFFLMDMGATAAQAIPNDQTVLRVTELPGSKTSLTNLAPGDWTEWAATVANTGTAAYPLAVVLSPDGANVLLLNPTNGLQFSIDFCPTAPIASTGAGPISFSCATAFVPLGSGPAVNVSRMTASVPIPAGATVGVRVRISVPSSVGNELQNVSGALNVAFSVAAGPLASTRKRPPVEAPLAPQWSNTVGTNMAAFVLGSAVVLLAAAGGFALIKWRAGRP